MYQSRFLLFFILITSFAFGSGGWISGGGELLKDSHNPWFLNNVNEVFYCVKFSNSNFGENQKNVENQLKSAIDFWKSEFSYAIAPEYKGLGKLKIANQNFLKVDCNDVRVDIKFQFGVLDKAQKQYLKQPNKYAAVTVRTHYDEVNLKGRGFVYVSPSGGPLAYEQNNVIKEAWAQYDGQLLYLTLVHELGHVFGLPHVGTMGALMSEGFVEMILTKNNNFNFKNGEFNFFSLVSKTHVICPQQSLLNIWISFFDLDKSEKCFQLNFRHDSKNQFFGKTRLEISAFDENRFFLRIVENIDLNMYKFNPIYPGVIWLPASQNIFDKMEYINGIQGVLGVSLVSVSKKGMFSSKKLNLKKSISVRFEQGKLGVSIDGVNEEGDLVNLL
ncbi:MAG: matrixin family metalloprotease [Bdellovibrionaceae bacterium]|nr:matrixin family metalloprotease [Pseudobdellovibrionaceae bacterium]